MTIKSEQLRIIHIYLLSSRRYRKTYNLEVHSLEHIPLNEYNLERGKQVTLGGEGDEMNLSPVIKANTKSYIILMVCIFI